MSDLQSGPTRARARLPATRRPCPTSEMHAASGPSGPRAGFWRRFAALLLDGIMLGIVQGIIVP